MKRYLLILIGIIFLFGLNSFLWADLNRSKVKEGIKAYQESQWDEALKNFQDALLDAPEDPVAHYNVAEAYYQKKNYEEALKSYEKALSTQDVNLKEQIYYNIGNTYYQMNKYKEAIQSYIKALDMNPNDEEAKHNLELVRAKLKEMAKKQPQQNQQQQKNKRIEPSEYAKKLKQQADLLVAKRKYSEASNLMEQGLKKDPTVAAYQDYMKRLKDIIEIEGTAV